jgi:hypothetical protein
VVSFPAFGRERHMSDRANITLLSGRLLELLRPVSCSRGDKIDGVSPHQLASATWRNADRYAASQMATILAR